MAGVLGPQEVAREEGADLDRNPIIGRFMIEKGKPRNPRIANAGKRSNVAVVRLADEFALAMAPIIAAIAQRHVAFRAIARELNRRQIKTRFGKRWAGAQVRLIVERLEKLGKGI
jgi:hypothetical protein